jgi:Fe-S-cluster containining protein
MGEHKHNKCRMCGHCCQVVVNIIPYNQDAAVWATARGYKMLDSSENWLAIEIPSRCPQLTDDNKCRLEKKKPQTCQIYPRFLKPAELSNLGLDRNRLLGPDCGYKE